jgi:hypothetical protein
VPRLLAALAAAIICTTAWAQREGLDRAVDETQRAQRQAAEAQTRVDRLDDETRRLLERYRAALWQTQQLNVYARQLDDLEAEQLREKNSLQAQLAELAVTEREIMPLMLRMLDGLERFVDADLPFLATERRERIANLRRLMADPDAGVSDRFRRILEAYQIEIDYGRGLGAERGSLPDGTVVDVLRVGRTALYFLSLDGSDGGWWDAERERWEPLESRYLTAVRQGLRQARETAAPDLLVLPLTTGGAP